MEEAVVAKIGASSEVVVAGAQGEAVAAQGEAVAEEGVAVLLQDPVRPAADDEVTEDKVEAVGSQECAAEGVEEVQEGVGPHCTRCVL